MDAAARYWSRATLRRNLRGAILLVLLVTIGAGGAMAAAAGARRSHTALHRLAARSNPADAMVFAENEAALSTAMHLPQLGAQLAVAGLALQPAPAACTEAYENYFPIWMATAGTPYGAVDRPRLIAGRLPDQSNPNEIALAEQHARRLKLHVGDHLQFKQFDEFEESIGCRPDAVGDVTVVGIERHLSELGAKPNDPVTWSFVTAAFAKQHPDVPHLFDNMALVRLERGERDLQAFTSAATAAGAEVQPIGQYVRTGAVQPALDAIAIGLWAVAGVLVIVAVTAVGVAFARQTSALEGDLATLSALGLDRRRSIVATATPLVLTVAAGVALAGGTAIALSRVHLIGLAAKVEPTPGFDIDGRVLGLGAAIALAVGVLLATWSAWRSTIAATDTDTRTATTRPGLVSRLQGAGAPPWLSIGAAYALVRGPRNARLPNRLATSAAAVGAAGVVAVLIFGGGLRHAQADKAVYGWGSWDGWTEADDAATVLGDDPDVVGLSRIRPRFALTLNKHSLLGIESHHIKGAAGPTVVSGRLPIGADEIALGENSAQEIGAHVGGTVVAKVPKGRASLRVVGIAAFPAFDSDPLAEGFLILRSATERLGFPDECNSTDCFENVAVAWRAGTDLDAKVERLEKAGVKVTRPDAGAEIRRLNEVDSLPRALAIAVAVLAAIGVAHALGATVIRRRRELAITRALGFTRSHVRRVVLVQGFVLGVVSATVGGVAGVIVGRFAWAQAANAIGIPRGVPVAMTTLVLALLAMVLLPFVLAVAPSVAAARATPAAGLREDQ
jgi:hypothetical protein